MIPTTTVTLYPCASQELNEYGDEVEGTTPTATCVPAAVVEDSQQRFAPADLRAELVEQFTIRVPSDTKVREGDRLVDNRTGATYQVHGVSKPQGLVVAPSIRLTTRRVGTQQ
jgi:hypothetical protein